MTPPTPHPHLALGGYLNPCMCVCWSFFGISLNKGEGMSLFSAQKLNECVSEPPADSSLWSFFG